MISTDLGRTWKYSCPFLQYLRFSSNDTSIYDTPKGDLVAFIRTAKFNDHTVIARSTDGGKSFRPWQDAGFQGHPHHALRLPDQRVLLVYGYRHQPFGIRARVLDAECTNATTAPEIVLREDGGTSDLGYPWATLMKDVGWCSGDVLFQPEKRYSSHCWKYSADLNFPPLRVLVLQFPLTKLWELVRIPTYARTVLVAPLSPTST